MHIGSNYIEEHVHGDDGFAIEKQEYYLKRRKHHHGKQEHYHASGTSPQRHEHQIDTRRQQYVDGTRRQVITDFCDVKGDIRYYKQQWCHPDKNLSHQLAAKEIM